MPDRSESIIDDFHNLKDDMTAFIEGHGMRRFRAYVTEDVQTVMWDPSDHAEAWKDFVELAKASGAAFVTVDDVVLKREEVDYLVERLSRTSLPSEEIEEARWLRSYVGKTGFLQLGFPLQGTIFLYEVSTAWYETYQRLVEDADAMSAMTNNSDDRATDEEL